MFKGPILTTKGFKGWTRILKNPVVGHPGPLTGQAAHHLEYTRNSGGITTVVIRNGGMVWVVPPPRMQSSPPGLCTIFRIGDPNLNLLLPQASWEGGQPNVWSFLEGFPLGNFRFGTFGLWLSHAMEDEFESQSSKLIHL